VTPSTSPTLDERVFRWLLGLYPPEARRDLGPGMLAMYRELAEGAREDGPFGRLGLLAREAAGLIAGATGERRDARRRRRPAKRNRQRSIRGPDGGRRGGIQTVEDMVQDLKYALRIMVKSPMFSGIAILTLALGIGAVTAIYSVVDAVLMEPLPFDEPDEIVLLWTQNRDEGQEAYFVSPQDFGDWREMNSSFEGMAAFWPTPSAITQADGTPARVASVYTTEHFFDVMGAAPLMGRTFGPDDGPGSQVVTVLSQGLWEQRFGADPTIVGRTVNIDGEPIEVIGVLRAEHRYPEQADLWINMTWPMSIQSRGARWMSAVGRLETGVPLERAQSDMSTVAARLAETHQGDVGWGVTMARLTDHVVGDTRAALWILLGSTAFILLIACANVANLLLSRAEVRSREIAVRTAFGAGRMRIAKQLMVESLMLATLGAVLGLGLAWVGIRALAVVAPASLPRSAVVSLDGTVLLTTLAATLVTGMLFGLAPIVRILRGDMAGAIRDGARGSRSASKVRMQSAFVVGQIALAAVLVIGAGLLVRSFASLRAIDTGFQAGGVLTFELDLNSEQAETDQDVSAFYQAFMQSLETAPGVVAVGASSSLPLGERVDYNQPFQIVDRPTQDAEELRANYRQVTPGFFEAMETPLLYGRSFNDLDVLDGAGVAIINEALAERFWPGQDPVGQRLNHGTWRIGPLGAILHAESEIVGVVADVKYDGLKSVSQPSIYHSYLQAPMRRMNVTVRTSGDPASLVPVVRQALADLDSTMPLAGVQTMEDVLDTAMSRDRFSMLLLSIFGLVALALGRAGGPA
jgi:predicted permease